MSILAVVVRYQTPISESQTIAGLRTALSADPQLARNFNFLIWDNSSEPLVNPHQSLPFIYMHSPVNLGVSGAFNGAMEYAREHECSWMLLLDQDTTISPEFLQTMLRHSRSLDADTSIAAIAPTVSVRGFVVSPRRQLFNRHCAYPAGQTGIADGEAFAINSGCLMRVSALQEIGGYSHDFWLDYSDMYVFHQFFLRGKKVWRAADARLEHDMSIMDYDRLMSPQRYRNFSQAESAFNDIYKGSIENSVQSLRLFVRAIKQRFKYLNPEFSRIAWAQFIYRLRVPRTERIQRWHAEGQKRIARQRDRTIKQSTGAS